MKPRLNLQTRCWQDARRDAQRAAQERQQRLAGYFVATLLLTWVSFLAWCLFIA